MLESKANLIKMYLRTIISKGKRTGQLLLHEVILQRRYSDKFRKIPKKTHTMGSFL